MLCHYSYLNNDIFNFQLNCAKILLIRQKFVSLQSCYYRYVMDNRLKRQAALYMLISLVDENNGSIDINSNAIRRSFNDVTPCLAPCDVCFLATNLLYLHSKRL